MSAKEPRVAVVTGANRGIGLEVSRQLAERGMTVMLTSRDRHSGETAALHLAEGRADAMVSRIAAMHRHRGREWSCG